MRAFDPGPCLRLAAAALLAAALGGCSGGGSAGASAASGASSAPPASGASAVSAAQWQAALAAIGPAYAPAQASFDDAALARWNGFLAAGWPAARRTTDPMLVQALTQAFQGMTSSAGVVTGVQSIVVDTTATPAFGLTGSPTRLEIQLPGASGAWSIAATLDLSLGVSTSVLGVPVSASVPGEVSVDVQGISISAPVDFDMSDPRRPVATKIGAPAIAMRVSITSPQPLIQQAAGPLGTLIGNVLQGALLGAGMLAPSQLQATIASLNVAPWGRGGPGALPVAAPIDLAARAADISDEMQRVHMPFEMVLEVRFDQPGYGNGSPIGYDDFGDSAIWTGSFLAGEAMRLDVTQDARALAACARALDGLTACLDAADPQGGLLARTTIPLSSTFSAQLAGWTDYYTGVHNGVPIGAIGQVSRDQYLGALMGITQAMLRAPPLRADAARLVGRMVRYIDAQGWIVCEHNTGIPSAVMVSSPELIWAFLSAGNVADRAGLGSLHDANLALPRVEWLSAWTSSRDEWPDYFKFNLFHEVLMTELACEADPALYREHLKGLEITRDVIGHHENAWFDAVYAIAVPSAAPALAAQIETELQRCALRGMRDFTATNSADPTIAQAPNPDTTPGAPPTVAAFPIPIEKRRTNDFLWQSSPFILDQTGDPHLQLPGEDVTLPYWAARAFGFIP
jgi:hypothetical protein